MLPCQKNYSLIMLWIIAIIVAALFLVWVALGYFGSRVETLSYTVLSSDKEYEIRELPEHIIAETTVSGNFDDASGDAFNILAGYIFGNNKKGVRHGSNKTNSYGINYIWGISYVKQNNLGILV